MTIDEAVDQLRTVMATHGGCGRLIVQPADIVQRELPEPLRQFYVRGNPENVSIPWVAEKLYLYGVEELDAAQAGYRYSANEPNLPVPEWQPNWLVIGSAHRIR